MRLMPSLSRKPYYLIEPDYLMYFNVCESSNVKNVYHSQSPWADIANQNRNLD